MISIVNYGLGNVNAIANIYKRLNVAFAIVASPEELSTAERIILPGVGTFDWAMTRLNASGMRPLLEKLVLEKEKPVLGICVGMQIMAQKSEEGTSEGLGWIGGEVRKFRPSNSARNQHIPHMGWNNVDPRLDSVLFRDLDSDSRFYFLHSYYFRPYSQNYVLSETEYIEVFASSVNSRNIFAVQFHPEKSHHWGIKLLKNFAEL